MANSYRRVKRILLALTLLLLCSGLVLVCSKSQDARSAHQNEVEAAVARLTVFKESGYVSARAKVYDNEELGIKGCDWVDMSEHLDVLIDLIYPPVGSKKQLAVKPICELEFGNKCNATLSMSVYDYGTSRLLYGFTDRITFCRSGNYNNKGGPAAKGGFIAESYALCALVRAKNENNEKAVAEYVGLLKLSCASKP